MQKKISVVMPIYNAHDYLRNCLDCLINQTLKDIEIICVDDESTDDTPQILHDYAEKDDRIKVIRQKNGGAGAARNNGMEYATGEYLSILDCDDFFELDMLEKSYQAAKNKNLDIVTFGCDFYDNESGTYRPCNYSINRKLLPQKDVFCAKDVERDVFKLFVGWSWDKLFRTEFVRKHNLLFQEQRTTNDMLFVFNGLLRADRIGTMEDVFAHHRRGLESLSVTREKSWMCFYNALIALRKEMYSIGCYERFEQDFKNYCVHFSLWNLNTLKEPTHTLLYNKLRDEWFAELDLLDHPKEYFYNKHEYTTFRNVFAQEADDFKSKDQSATKGKTSPFARGLYCIKTQGLLHTIKLVVKKIIN